MLKALLTSSLALAASAQHNATKPRFTPAQSVDELDVASYLGKWYQMYADALVLGTFQKGAQCATAQYGLNEDGTISVHNYQTTNSPDSNVQTIDGYAFVRDPQEPGRLTVDLGTGAPAPYWVLALGPQNAEGLYDWSIVSDPVSASLFVLARDPQTFYEVYDKKVSALLDDLGFTTALNEPIAIYQGSDCVYETNLPTTGGSSKTEWENNVKFGVDTVDELDINSYIGLWYQMYADEVVYNSFEKDAYCVTAKYGVNDDGTISVHNYQTTGSPDHSNIQTIDGYAYVKNEKEPGQLTVNLGTDSGDAPYWVVGLGPQNKDGLYDWSIVSDPFKAFLFVLARDPQTFKEKYDVEVSAMLKNLGFTKSFNTPIATYQESDCVYE